MMVCYGKGCSLEKGGVRGGWCSKEVGVSFGVGVWKCIRRGWDAFAGHVRYEVEIVLEFCFGMIGVGIYL